MDAANLVPDAQPLQPPNDRPDLNRHEVRAVVRLVDLPSRKTNWFASGDVSVVSELMKLLPPIGQNFMVVWQEREAVSFPLDLREGMKTGILLGNSIAAATGD